MRNENECNVIKDLLPSYIDNLTSIESNELINKHLKECDSCKKFLNNIKNEEVKEEKETEFLKFARDTTVLLGHNFLNLQKNIIKNYLI